MIKKNKSLIIPIILLCIISFSAGAINSNSYLTWTIGFSFGFFVGVFLTFILLELNKKKEVKIWKKKQ